MRFPGRSIPLSLAVALSACAGEAAIEPGPSTGFPLAFHHDDCAPWDGAALTFLFTHEAVTTVFDAPYPHVRLTSYRPPPSLTGQVIEWTLGESDQGYGAWCTAEGECEEVSRVRLSVSPYATDDNSIRGELYLELARGQFFTDTFSAARIPFQALCG